MTEATPPDTQNRTTELQAQQEAESAPHPRRIRDIKARGSADEYSTEYCREATA